MATTMFEVRLAVSLPASYFLLGGGVLVAADFGHAKCQCWNRGPLTELNVHKTTDAGGADCFQPVQQDGGKYCYASDYGGAGCKTYDNTLEPDCAGPTGIPILGRPSWCEDSWCFVDTENCDTGYIDDVLPSYLFPNSGLFYSYKTCGDEQTFAKWSYARNKTAVELKDVTEGYSKDIRDAIEQHLHLVSDGESQGVGCEGLPHMCNCVPCQISEAWTAQTNPRTDQLLDFKSANVVVNRERWNDPNNHAAQSDKCVSPLIGRSMRTTALKEYNDDNRIAYIYYGSQGTGAMMMWPAFQWCTDTFDSRLRPWYATAAAGPKDVVLLLDKSGSMDQSARWKSVQVAAKQVLRTLGAEDWATIITFNSIATAFQDELTLHDVTDANREKLDKFIDEEFPIGGTKFLGGLQKAGATFRNSYAKGRTSGCVRILLFLTDGEDTEGFKASDADGIEGLEGVTFFTYSFGTDIGDQSIMRKLACQHQGIWHPVPDGADIASVMSKYYQMFAAGVDTKEARWTEYIDAITQTPLVAACYAVYDRTGATGLLHGVICTDLNLIVDLATFKTKPGYTEAWAAMRKAATTCTSIRVTSSQLKAFRELASPGGCRECDLDPKAECPPELVGDGRRGANGAFRLTSLAWILALGIFNALASHR
eukprot:TRINITY_DN8991_c0_g1_i1.p1 TRINITY_DN8991_c0_g1~~TRINITY_DN8991_c0_g1_i1.p1  ORF type:complete len:651 (-),score=91.24 TRINITY_DN8991_c0_g1_i1:262-2214(-)